MEGEISELYNFNYNCLYNNIKNEDDKKKQHKYDLSKIISESDNIVLYNCKLYGIFILYEPLSVSIFVAWIERTGVAGFTAGVTAGSSVIS